MLSLVLTGGIDRDGKPIADLVLKGVEWVAVTYDDNHRVNFVDEREENAAELGWESWDERTRVLDLDTPEGTFQSWSLVEQLEDVPLQELFDLILKIEYNWQLAVPRFARLRARAGQLRRLAALVEVFAPEAAKYLREGV